MRRLGERRRRTARLLAALKRRFPKAGIALRYQNPWQLLVAVVLSAQCTDKKVNEVTATLFRRYPTLSAYLAADPREFARAIRPTGFYRAKARNILAAAKIVASRFKGRVPRTMEELVTLPGVGRKSANVILGNAYGRVEGIAVDTHVRRLALKFDLTDARDPKKIERDLMELIPRREWFRFTYLAIEYGRTVCPARPHPCREHFLSKIWPPAARRFPRARGRM